MDYKDEKYTEIDARACNPVIMPFNVYGDVGIRIGNGGDGKTLDVLMTFDQITILRRALFLFFPQSAVYTNEQYDGKHVSYWDGDKTQDIEFEKMLEGVRSDLKEKFGEKYVVPRQEIQPREYKEDE